MGFIANKVITGEIPLNKIGPSQGLPALTPDEIMFLIQYISESNFKGRDVENVYKIVLKLQDLFLHYQKLEESKNSKQ